MNRDEGQYVLSHIFQEILMKKKYPNGNQLATLKTLPDNNQHQSHHSDD